jgi:AraC-like DNA-binding protein
MKNKNIFKLLCTENGFVTVQACVQQTWKNYKTFSSLNAPKENDLLLFVSHCKITYSMKSGSVFSASHGDVVFVPSGAEYTLTVTERDEKSGCTYGINFLIFDEDHRRVFLENPEVFPATDTEPLLEIFKKMSLGYHTGTHSRAKTKSYFYQIISILHSRNSAAKRKEFFVIEEGIRYLENDTTLSLSVAEIAKKCHVSQNWFCRLFKEYSGSTPGEYILKTKMEQAKSMLRETDSPVSEIAKDCGFPDPSYFCRLFKKREGISPLDFRRR